LGQDRLGQESLGNDQQTRYESKTGLVEQVNTCLNSGNYSRALELLRGAAAEFPNDPELSKLEALAEDGVKRNEEAQRLITESQELFAQQKSAEALQFLRKAYELDKKNSLARAILANALVEHAHSLLETDWLEAERLTNQALALNPVHPTAKTVLGLILDLKKTSSAEDWVSQASKLQSSGDLFAALAWVAEGLAVHPHEPKLLQIQDSIQRDQGIQRRHARRRDMEGLRRMELEIDGAVDAVAKKALAERIQAMAAKYWTDGAVLTVANSLLQRLGFASQAGSSENSTASPNSKGATVIFHVPRASAPEPSRANTGQISSSQISSNLIPSNLISSNPISSNPISPDKVRPGPIRTEEVQSGNVASAVVPPSPTPLSKAPQSQVPSSTVPQAAQILPNHILPNKVLANKVPPSIAPQEKVPTLAPEPQPALQQAAVVAVEPAAAVQLTSSSSQPEQPTSSNLKALILVSAAAAIVAVAATLFFARRHYAPRAANSPAAPAVTLPAVTAPTVSATAVSVPPVSVAAVSVPERATPEPSLPAAPLSSSTAAAKVSPHIRKNEAKLISNLQPQSQPQPRPASLTIQGGAPGTTVFVDQTSVGIVQPDGTLSVSTVNPGDHTLELRKERFKPRQFKEHFVAGGAISLTAADAALEASPGELKISFSPADANVAIVKGEHLTMVKSGVPLNLVAGTYTLTTRTADGFRSSSTLEVTSGQSQTLDLSLAPNGMSKWDDPGAWKQEKDSFLRKGGDFVLYGVVPASGTFVFSAMPARSHLLQWVLNYTDSKNYVLFQLDDNYFYRTVIRNGQKTDEIKVPDKGDKKTFRTLHIRVSPTELVHEIRNGDSWTVVDRWTQPGANLGKGKFGFYIPGGDQVALSGFAHYPDLNLR
jgi:tetratricopeptide (TPR) repeat protein